MDKRQHEETDINEYSATNWQQLCVQIVQRTLQGILITDNKGRIIYVNEAFTISTGYYLDEVRGKNPSILQSGRHDGDFYKTMWCSVRQNGQWQGEIWNRRKDGEIFVEWANITALLDEDGQVSHYSAVFSDITERKSVEFKLRAENRQLQQLSVIDPLTGVANRRAFDEALNKEWKRCLLYQTSLSLLFIDIDFFKSYNDSYGHQQGDEALRMVAGALKGALKRPADFLARYGGEEFSVILPGLDLSDAVATAQTLREAVSALKTPHKGSTVSPFLSISIGCSSVMPSADGSALELVESADKALYGAKERGRNRVQIRA